MTTFSAPLRYLFDIQDLTSFHASQTYEDLLGFIAAINAAIADQANDAQCHEGQIVQRLVSLLGQLGDYIDAIPPIQQPMRYGNRAYRQWHVKLVQEAPQLCRQLISGAEGNRDLTGAEGELAPYLCECFGNATRIDYGTGHETGFLIFLFCLGQLGLINQEDFIAVGCKVFPAYIKVCRKLQRTYFLEPAGSHGVWSLDDYQFLVFLFGSSQLANHKYIRPKSIHSADTLEAYGDKYLYLGAIRFITEVKKGAPFTEHSPILSDIAGLPSWSKVNEGLAKMYRVEVLGKLPVVQHLLFGSLFPATWTPSRPPVPSEALASALADPAAMEAARLTVPVDESVMAVAPWVTSPPAGRPRLDPGVVTVAPWAVAARGMEGIQAVAPRAVARVSPVRQSAPHGLTSAAAGSPVAVPRSPMSPSVSPAIASSTIETLRDVFGADIARPLVPEEGAMEGDTATDGQGTGADAVASARTDVTDTEPSP